MSVPASGTPAAEHAGEPSKPQHSSVARTIVRMATSSDMAETTGAYFSRDEPVRSVPLSLDTSEMRKVWQASADLTGLAVYP